jgi:ribosome-associated heat shock protein Hsp15
MSCRIDKYVWAVRLTKTRSLATQLINKGKIRLNDTPTKPSKEVKIGDDIFIIRSNATFQYRVINLLDRRVGAKLVPDYLIDITPKEELEKYKEFQLNQRSYKDFGTGKPSKKQRRDLDEFLENWDEV